MVLLSTTRMLFLVLLYLTLSFFLFQHFNRRSLFFDIEADKTKQAHIDIGNPHNGEAGNQIAAPVIQQEFVTRNN